MSSREQPIKQIENSLVPLISISFLLLSLPNYEGFCKTLETKRLCDQPRQCEWVGNALDESIGCTYRCAAKDEKECDAKPMCKYDSETEVCIYQQDMDTRKNMFASSSLSLKKKRLFDR